MSEPGAIVPSAFQQRVLAVPESYDVVLAGGRGGGKTYAMCLLIVQAIVLHAAKFRGVLIRRSFPALLDVVGTLRDILGRTFGSSVTYSGNDHLFRFTSGATLEVGHLDDEAAFDRWQGRSFSHAFFDEAGQWPSPLLIDRFLSSLRGTRDTPARLVLACNPGGCGHAFLAKRYVLNATPWAPTVCADTLREYVLCPSTLDDNPNINQPQYRRALLAACATDQELGEAWVSGSWAICRGAFFADSLSEIRSAVGDEWQPSFFVPVHSFDPVANEIGGHTWRRFCSFDHGAAAPAVLFVLCESPGDSGPDGKWYPKGSIVALDELSLHDPADMSRGLNLTVPQVADRIKSICLQWGINPMDRDKLADDSIFAEHAGPGSSIAAAFKREGVVFVPAGKGGRVSGWSRMRTMLADAGKSDRPGLYVARRCRGFWDTAPSVPRDPRRPDDIDSKSLDHWVDSLRYSLNPRPGAFRSGHTRELWSRRPW